MYHFEHILISVVQCKEIDHSFPLPFKYNLPFIKFYILDLNYFGLEFPSQS